MFKFYAVFEVYIPHSALRRIKMTKNARNQDNLYFYLQEIKAHFSKSIFQISVLGQLGSRSVKKLSSSTWVILIQFIQKIWPNFLSGQLNRTECKLLRY